MDVNPAGEVYSILRDNPILLVISSVVDKSLKRATPLRNVLFFVAKKRTKRNTTL
jgi:hypothetical protein